MSKPCVAESDVERATTSGMATPKACGQDVTITVTIRSKANAMSLPEVNQNTNVTVPVKMEIMVSHLATLSARFWVFDLALCAGLNHLYHFG